MEQINGSSYYRLTTMEQDALGVEQEIIDISDIDVEAASRSIAQSCAELTDLEERVGLSPELTHGFIMLAMQAHSLENLARQKAAEELVIDTSDLSPADFTG